MLDRLAQLNRGMDQGTLSDPEACEREELEQTLASVVGDEEL